MEVDWHVCILCIVIAC